ncbi:alpha/beta hydrolase family protein [Flocculibacter collagenilyticus]|uniref:alpha/beta hydrolase family protein n=1 Tax=Flocculibacter collagenilyticus TaxID=2744479 RepID=UPI0018F2C7EE|nr:hypothetical protein [Flocculibacter collagenilyticus]
MVGLNHFGESWRYGRENIDPATTMKLWQRAEDTTFVLDHFSKNNPFQHHLNWHNVVVVGHSSGGQTAASLAGVTLDMANMTNYCQLSKSNGDMGCTYANGKQAEKIGKIASYKQSYRDNRVKAVIMLDPAVGPAATKESLQSINIPALIIGAQNNEFVPFKYHAGYYAEYMPNAELMTLNNDEGHFIFLDSCSHKHKAKGVSLCEDREGVDRKQVHSMMSQKILAFLSQL